MCLGSLVEAAAEKEGSEEVDDPRVAMLALLTSAKRMVLTVVALCVPFILIRSVMFTYRPLLGQKLSGAM